MVKFMPEDAIWLVASALFFCLAAGSALIALAAARQTRQITRTLRLALQEIELLTDKHSIHIRRLTSAVGALGRWNREPEPKDDQETIPDPKADPIAWKRAMRAKLHLQTMKVE